MWDASPTESEAFPVLIRKQPLRGMTKGGSTQVRSSVVFAGHSWDLILRTLLPIFHSQLLHLELQKKTSALRLTTVSNHVGPKGRHLGIAQRLVGETIRPSWFRQQMDARQGSQDTKSPLLMQMGSEEWMGELFLRNFSDLFPFCLCQPRIPAAEGQPTAKTSAGGWVGVRINS